MVIVIFVVNDKLNHGIKVFCSYDLKEGFSKITSLNDTLLYDELLGLLIHKSLHL